MGENEIVFKSYIGKIIITGVTLVACLTVIMLGFGSKTANPHTIQYHVRKIPSVREIPLYAVDGATIIGKFRIENGETQIFTNQPND